MARGGGLHPRDFPTISQGFGKLGPSFLQQTDFPTLVAQLGLNQSSRHLLRSARVRPVTRRVKTDQVREFHFHRCFEASQRLAAKGSDDAARTAISIAIRLGNDHFDHLPLIGENAKKLSGPTSHFMFIYSIIAPHPYPNSI